MRRTLPILLTAVLIFSLVGCAPGVGRDTLHNEGSTQSETVLEVPSTQSVYGAEQPAQGDSLVLGEPEEMESVVSSDAPSSSVSQGNESQPAALSESALEQDTQEESSSAASLDIASSSATEQETEVLAAKTVYSEVRAVWFSYLTLEPMVKDKTKAEFTKTLDQAFSNVADTGFNTVFVHVRPFGDALYQSSYYPWSYLLSGTEGKNPGYDPLKIMCELADQHELRIEAWINPYRVRATGDRALASSNQAKKWIASGNDAALSWNGGVYYNPGSAEARKLIINGVKEIVKNYNVDGIHFDDYFYPTTDLSFDKATYQASGSSKSQADWRRENVNILVREVYAAIKKIDASCVFGISPQGNMKNNYDGQFIDCEKWLANKGYVDYICPQIYFGFQNTGLPYAATVSAWDKLIKTSGIDLYIGIAAYKLGQADQWAGAGKTEWIGTTDLLSQMVQTARKSQHYGGSAFYSYDALFLSNTKQAAAEKGHLADLFR